MTSYDNMMFNYRHITRIILIDVRQTPIELSNQDRFYEIYLENIMAESLQMELVKVSTTLNVYK